MTAAEPTLSGEQAAAVEQVLAFVAAERPRRPWLTKHGLAGTGKTTVLAHLARRLPGALLCAFTGKAAHVLRTKTGLDTSTLHSAIFTFAGLGEDEETGRRNRPIFVDKEETDLRHRVVLLDECSTVGTYLAEKLLATGARVVACGDPGQLPPVRDAQFFDDPDVVLRTVHRQAWDSPIIRQAHAIRNTGTYRSDTADFQVVSRTTPDLLLQADVALCWRNSTRSALNASRRAALGRAGPVLRAGEPVMCLRNDHRLRTWNGAIYPVLRDRSPGEELVLDVDGVETTIYEPTVEDVDPDFAEARDQDERKPFSLAYAATVHKFQGSEVDHVLLVDENRGGDRRSFLYTGVTRAAKRVTIVCPSR